MEPGAITSTNPIAKGKSNANIETMISFFCFYIVTTLYVIIKRKGPQKHINTPDYWDFVISFWAT